MLLGRDEKGQGLPIIGTRTHATRPEVLPPEMPQRAVLWMRSFLSEINFYFRNLLHSEKKKTSTHLDNSLSPFKLRMS